MQQKLGSPVCNKSWGVQYATKAGEYSMQQSMLRTTVNANAG